jgi:hypothetical protein
MRPALVVYITHEQFERRPAIDDARPVAAFCQGKEMAAAAEGSVQKLHDFGCSFSGQ